jgi:hypothetical protein
VSDFVNPKRKDNRDTNEAQLSARSVTRSESDRDSKPAKTVGSTTARTLKAAPLPDIKVEPYKTALSSSSSPKTPVMSSSHKIRSTTPDTSMHESPQSSPSQYSQDEDDVSSEGTISSDEEAKSLLAQADSGAKRVAPLNIRKKSNGVDQNQIERARRLMTGKEAGRGVL